MASRAMRVERRPRRATANLAAELRRGRKAKVFQVACSSPENTGRELPLHVAGPLSSLNRERMAPGATPESVINVATRTLDSILIEAGTPSGFDFLSIDVGSHEIEVLRGFDIGRWRPRLILLEDHVADLSRHRYLPAAGYRIIRRYENNGWYVPRDSTSGSPDGRTGGRSCASTISPCRFAYYATCRAAFGNRSLRNFRRKVSGFSRDGGEPFDLMIHHHGDEIDKRRFCEPADFCSDLRAVRDGIAVDSSEKAGVEDHVVGPVAANVTECNLAERTDGIGLAGSNHVVVGSVALQHFMHGGNKVAGKAEVAANINVSER